MTKINRWRKVIATLTGLAVCTRCLRFQREHNWCQRCAHRTWWAGSNR